MKTRLGSALLAMLVAGAMAIHPVGAGAQAVDADTVERFGSKKFWDYALCGASIVLASGTGGWVMAALVCGRALTEHWTE